MIETHWCSFIQVNIVHSAPCPYRIGRVVSDPLIRKSYLLLIITEVPCYCRDFPFLPILPVVHACSDWTTITVSGDACFSIIDRNCVLTININLQKGKGNICCWKGWCYCRVLEWWMSLQKEQPNKRLPFHWISKSSVTHCGAHATTHQIDN